MIAAGTIERAQWAVERVIGRTTLELCPGDVVMSSRCAHHVAKEAVHEVITAIESTHRVVSKDEFEGLVRSKAQAMLVAAASAALAEPSGSTSHAPLEAAMRLERMIISVASYIGPQCVQRAYEAGRRPSDEMEGER